MEICSEMVRVKPREGYISKTYICSTGTTIVHRPILTPEEAERNMKRISDAAASLILALEISRKEKNQYA